MNVTHRPSLGVGQFLVAVVGQFLLAVDSGRSRPSGFGMYTRRDGFARYAPR